MTRISQLLTKIAASSMTIISLLVIQARPLRAVEEPKPWQTRVSPIIESVSDTFAFISWVTQNPGGTILHFSVVQYGKDPEHLDLKAESPTRINPSHPDMVFRVRMNDLDPGTTYYYKVSSRQATGALDPGTSAIDKFTTRATSSVGANK